MVLWTMSELSFASEASHIIEPSAGGRHRMLGLIGSEANLSTAQANLGL